MKTTFLFRFVVLATLVITCEPLVVRSVAKTTATAVATKTTIPDSPWTAVFSFVKSLWSALHGTKPEQKAAQQTLPQTIDLMGQSSNIVAPWPDLMVDSRRLRKNTIELAQEINFRSQVLTISEDEWNELKVQINSVKVHYQEIYGNKNYVAILKNHQTYASVRDAADSAWDKINQFVEVKTASLQMKAIQEMNQGLTEKLYAAAMLPEIWATDEAQFLVDQYKDIVAKSKSANVSAQPLLSGKSQIELAVWREGGQKSIPALFQLSSGARFAEQRQNKAVPDEEVIKAPRWMTKALNTTRSQYKTDWQQTLLFSLIGALLGFVALMLISAFIRSWVSPRQQLQLDTLSRSLAFRMNETETFEREIGSLHADILKYILGETANKAKTASAGGGSTDHEHPAVLRIRELRNMLVQGKGSV